MFPERTDADDNDYDHARAVRLVRQMAEHGNAEAQYRLGEMAGRGEGMLPDLAEAVRWYAEAASRGHPQAQFRLGMAYGLGEGVCRDEVAAYGWLTLAVGRYHLVAARKRAQLAATMTPDEIAQAEFWVRTHGAGKGLPIDGRM